jgi:rubrerythrin
MAIDSIEALRTHLQWAMRVELSLVPVYLFAAYSICDARSESSKLIISVAAEEMLHATIDANLLVAIGGEPKFYEPGFAPSYPMRMPHHDPPILLELRRASRDVLDLFCTIEKPQGRGAVPEDDQYETQGQFYHAIELAFERFAGDDLFAHNRVDRQFADPSYYAPVAFDADDSGGLEPITDMGSVRRALDTVIHQGEGLSDERWADPAHQELTHYYKFLALRDGDKPVGDVWPAAANPKAEDMTPPLRDAAVLSNAVYSLLLVTMDELYQPMAPEARGSVVGRLYALMKDVLGPLARFLMAQPIAAGSDTHAGPPFAFHSFSLPDTAVDEVWHLAQASAAVYPELAPVAAGLESLSSAPSA